MKDKEERKARKKPAIAHKDDERESQNGELLEIAYRDERGQVPPRNDGRDRRVVLAAAAAAARCRRQIAVCRRRSALQAACCSDTVSRPRSRPNNRRLADIRDRRSYRVANVVRETIRRKRR